MNLNDRAARDARAILESAGCASAVATIHYADDSTVTVSGELGDIDSLLDKNEGQQQKRSIVFTCSSLSLMAKPEKGNRVDIEKGGEMQTFYIARVELDRVIEVCRMVLSTEPEPEYKD